MTWTVVNLAGTSPGNSSTNAFFGSVTVGNLVIVTIAYAGTITSVTDSTGSNTYTLANGNTIGTPQSAVYYSVITTGGAGITVTANGSITLPVIVAYEYSFTPGTISVASTNQGQGTGTSVSGAYLPFGVQPALVISTVGNDVASEILTANSGFNLQALSTYTAGNNYGFAFFRSNPLNATASPVIPGGTFAAAVPWSTASAVFVSTGDTTPSSFSVPFSQAIGGGASFRGNSAFY